MSFDMRELDVNTFKIKVKEKINAGEIPIMVNDWMLFVIYVCRYT